MVKVCSSLPAYTAGAAAVANIFRYGLRDQVISGPAVGLTEKFLGWKVNGKGRQSRWRQEISSGLTHYTPGRTLGYPSWTRNTLVVGQLSLDLLRAVFIECWCFLNLRNRNLA